MTRLSIILKHIPAITILGALSCVSRFAGSPSPAVNIWALSSRAQQPPSAVVRSPTANSGAPPDVQQSRIAPSDQAADSGPRSAPRNAPSDQAVDSKPPPSSNPSSSTAHPPGSSAPPASEAQPSINTAAETHVTFTDSAVSANPPTIADVEFRTFTLPFGCQLSGIDDNGDVAAVGGGFNVGFVLHKGDKSTSLIWSGLAPTGHMLLAMNSKGDIYTNGYTNVTNNALFLYNSRDKSFSPVNLPFTRLTAADSNGHVAANGAVVSVSVGAPGTLEAPTDRPAVKAIECSGKSQTVINGMNNLEQVVGTCGGEGGRGFMYDGKTNSIKWIEFPDAFSTTPIAINDNGTIVGSYVRNLHHAGVSFSRGFVYSGGEFHELIPANELTQSAKSFRYAPRAINNRGEIVGVAVVDGRNRSFLAVARGSKILSMFDALTGPLSKPPEVTLTAGDDPNLPRPYGKMTSGSGVVEWRYEGKSVRPTISGSRTYLGYNDMGSWFVDDTFVYVFNASNQTIVSYFHDQPRSIKATKAGVGGQ
jgi:hypothetical protein